MVESAETTELREKLQAFYEATASYQLRLFEASSGYNQVVVLAGYAGFFTIWSATSNDLARWIILLSGALMGVSLTVYVSWTVYSMLTMSSQMLRLLNEATKGPDGFIERMQKLGTDIASETNRYLRFWKPIVWCAGVPAGLGALLLTASAFLAVANHAGH